MARNDFVPLETRLESMRDHILDLIYDVQKQQHLTGRVIIPSNEVSKKLGDLDAGLWSIYHSVIKVEVKENVK